MISTFTALIDANVFYGARLRSLVIYLAQSGAFRARWTDKIHDEWINNLLQKRTDLKRGDLEKTRASMDKAVPDCLVSGYESLIETLDLPDNNDRHVLAAAIRVGANVIVTFNVKDFPEDKLSKWGIHVKTPDDFILDLESLYQTLVLPAVEQDRKHYKSPPLSLDDYLQDLTSAGLPKLAEYLNKIRIAMEDSGSGSKR